MDPHSSTQFNIRDARIEDLDIMTKIWIEAFKDDAPATYFYRYRDEYKTEHYENQKKRMAVQLENEVQNWKVMVAEVPSSTDEGNNEVVAVAVWEVHHNRSRAMDSLNYKPRPDVCDKRLNAYSRWWAQAEDEHLKRYRRDRRVELDTLAVKPTYQHRGIGKALTEWGISYVAERGAIIESSSSLPGRTLNLKLGFKQVAEIFVQVKGEEDSMTEYMLVYDPSEKKAGDGKVLEQEA